MEKKMNLKESNFFEYFQVRIYILRDAVRDREYLLYFLDTNTYHLVSKSRCIEYLEHRIIIENNFDIWAYQREVYKIDRPLSDRYYIEKRLKELAIMIDDISFKPVQEEIFSKNNKKYFNTYKIPKYFIRRNSKPMSYYDFSRKCPYHTKLLLNLHNNDEKAVQDTLMKIADKLHHPEKKAKDVIVFYPAERAGKGIFYDYILSPLAEQYAGKILMSRLDNQFNGFLRKLLFLCIEESKQNMRLTEMLKELVTEKTTLINEKNQPQREEEIYFLTFVFSNNMNPIDLGKNRGSFYICRSLGSNTEESQQEGSKFVKHLPFEREYLVDYLWGLEFSHESALVPYNNQAKQEVIEINKNSIELFYDYLLSFPDLDSGLKTLHEQRFSEKMMNLDIRASDDNVRYIAKDKFKDAYNNFCVNENLRHNIISHNKDIVQLWALFNIANEAQKKLTTQEDQRKWHVNYDKINQHIQERYEDE